MQKLFKSTRTLCDIIFKGWINAPSGFYSFNRVYKNSKSIIFFTYLQAPETECKPRQTPHKVPPYLHYCSQNSKSVCLISTKIHRSNPDVEYWYRELFADWWRLNSPVIRYQGEISTVFGREFKRGNPAGSQKDLPLMVVVDGFAAKSVRNDGN